MSVSSLDIRKIYASTEKRMFLFFSNEWNKNSKWLRMNGWKRVEGDKSNKIFIQIILKINDENFIR